ncbi:hypothetical protein ACFO25_06635 [Paenactinomyces guangxiensis]|uniref:Uncharacterized protein n=1 Tax=Paenactinomyces guangxiensis TaxID=1490290 RepID=A0A7W1WNZ1_9BACL|nr:hypothetical protein [Paenactinomyces guangxiensis]MBA4493273.1 hypothetical protein [Paenactinomyces guangxiensis]MBH8589876.1 hypothetical protein [Paenactinomyces guangxiensis]
MRRDERGMALPVVVAVLTILFILVSFLVSQSVYSRQAQNLYWERMRAQYAAESGIALIQQRLEREPNRIKSDVFQINGLKVTTEILKPENSYIQVRATASGRFGVKQTIQAEIDPHTLAVIRWIR